MPRRKRKAVAEDSDRATSKLAADSDMGSTRPDTARRLIEDSSNQVQGTQTPAMRSHPRVVIKKFIESAREFACNEFDEVWSSWDNFVVGSQWACTWFEDDDFQHLGSQNDKRKVLWIACIMLLSVDPLELLDTTPGILVAKDDGWELPFDHEFHPSPLWSPEFGENLTRIITHPLWDGPRSRDKVTFMLKWAVICRTDDRRPMRWTNPTTCSIIDALVGAEHTAAQPLSELHESIRRMAVSLGRTPSIESDLLHLIAAKTPTPTAPMKCKPTQPYVLCLKDLTNIIAAVDSCKALVNCEISYLNFVAFLGDWDKTVNLCDYESLYDWCLRANVRRRVSRTREPRNAERRRR